MRIYKATLADSKTVLELLDQFRTEINRINGLEKVSTSARDCGPRIVNQVFSDPSFAAFLAEDKGQAIGILTIYKTPVLRKGQYKAEIEEMFVVPSYQGKGVAQLLSGAAFDWAREQGVAYISLETGSELERAHGFYKKQGYKEYGKAFKLDVE